MATYDVVRVVLVTGPNARKWFADYRSKVSAQPISGLGDAAFYDGYASISVLKGDAYVRIARVAHKPAPLSLQLVLCSGTQAGEQVFATVRRRLA